MTPLNCDKASFLLERRWDRALSPQEERALDEHLAVCATCRDEAAAIELADAAFNDLPTLEPCRDIAGAVAAAIARESAAEPKRSWFWLFSAALAAVVAAVWRFGLTIHLDWQRTPLLSTVGEAVGIYWRNLGEWVRPFLSIGGYLAPTYGPILLAVLALETVAIFAVLARRGRVAGLAGRARGI
jgi:hypothetical protein